MSNEKKVKSDHVSETQKELILAFMKDDLQFAAGKFDRNYTITRSQMKWKELSNILNTFQGPKKDWKSWKRTWQDIKSKTKLKYLKQEVKGEIPLNKYQDEVMTLIKLSEELYGNCEKDDWLDDVNFEENFEDTKCKDYINDNDNEDAISIQPKRMKMEAQANMGDNVEAKEEIKIIFSESEESQEYNSKHRGYNSLKPKAYCDEKLAILERIAVAKEKSAMAKQEIAFELKNITSLLLGYINK